MVNQENIQNIGYEFEFVSRGTMGKSISSNQKENVNTVLV